MPGIVGFTSEKTSSQTASQVLRQMQELLSYGESRHRDELFCSAPVWATRSHTNILQKRPQPDVQAGTYVWLDGEFYNQKDLARQANLPLDISPTQGEDSKLLLQLYLEDNDFTFLRHVDGIYSAVVYDSQAEVVHLISDRYGLRHLYWATHKDGIAWSSEVKAMLELPGFTIRIDETALRDFLGVGHLLNDRTWLDGVTLLPGATVLTWDLRLGSLSRRCYWDYDEIRQLTGKIDEIELAEELGRLFKAAVARRCESDRVGVTLSGGLDSRALLAAMPEDGQPIQALTFGQEGCREIKIAAAAAKKKGAAHHVLSMSAAEWLTLRPEAVWWTDGELDLLHMHVLTIIPGVKEFFEIGFDGCGANGIIGDAWIEHETCSPSEYLSNRQRRFLILGPSVVRSFIEERFPFFDNQFVELSLAAPNYLKKNNRLYRMMLLRAFPAFYEDIPWQRTGAPIKWPHRSEERGKTLVDLKDKLVRIATWYGLFNFSHKGFADYSAWIRQEPARKLFQDMLTSPKALYSEYIPREPVERDLAKHLAGEDRTEKLCRVLTLEIWLKHLFEERFKSSAFTSKDLQGVT